MAGQQRKRAHRLQHPVRACDSRQEGHGLQQTCWAAVVNWSKISLPYSPTEWMFSTSLRNLVVEVKSTLAAQIVDEVGQTRLRNRVRGTSVSRAQPALLHALLIASRLERESRESPSNRIACCLQHFPITSRAIKNRKSATTCDSSNTTRWNHLKATATASTAPTASPPRNPKPRRTTSPPNSPSKRTRAKLSPTNSTPAPNPSALCASPCTPA